MIKIKKKIIWGEIKNICKNQVSPHKYHKKSLWKWICHYTLGEVFMRACCWYVQG